MPKITAPTVHEHRARMNERLVDAAENILREGGVQALTAGAVAKEAGIARNSIYRYVDSVDDLRLRVLERNVPRWRAAVFSGIPEDLAPLDRLVAFARASVRESKSNTSHAWLVGLYRAPRRGGTHGTHGAHDTHGVHDGEVQRARADVRGIHDFITGFIESAWREAGAPDPELRAAFTRVIIFQAFRCVAQGADTAATMNAMEQAIRGMGVGLGADRLTEGSTEAIRGRGAELENSGREDGVAAS